MERLHDSIDTWGPAIMELMKTNDAKAGVLAFVEKRKPKWTND